MQEERGGLYFPWRGAPLPSELVSQHRCVNLAKTNDNDRTHKNAANILPGHMAMLLSGQVPHRSNLSQLFWNGLWLQKKKTNRGGVERLRTYFFEKNPEIFLFFFCTSGNSGKTMLHPWKFGKIMYVTSLGNFKVRTKNENYLQPITHTDWLFPLTDFNAGCWAQYAAFTSSSTADITLNSCTNELLPRYQWQLTLS